MDKKEFDRFNYQNSYNRENYDRITIMLPKGSKDKLQETAKSRGTSVSGLIKEILVRELGI